MTNPEQSTGPAHPARAAGYGLLGVAVIALVIGLVSLFTGGPDDDTPSAQSTPPSATSDSPGTSTDAPGTATGEPTSPSPGPSETSPPAGTTTGPTTTGNAGGTTTDTPPPPVTTKPPVRVYNNSTTQGLAVRASDDVERAGWQVAEKGNYSQGTIPTTTVYFRPGTEEEASARDLARILNARVEARFDGIQAAHAGIIVIVTNDYKGPVAKAAS